VPPRRSAPRLNTGRASAAAMTASDAATTPIARTVRSATAAEYTPASDQEDAMTQTLGRAELQAVSDRLQDAFARRNPAAFAACHTLEGVVESPMFATLRGRKAIEEAQRAFFTSFPDVAATIDATLIDPPHIAVFVTMHATHVNEFFGLPGTGRHIEVRVARLLR